MNTMKWLVKRELWENKGMLLWAPLATAALMILMVLMALAYGATGHIELNGQMADVGHITMTGPVKTKVLGAVASGYMAASAPILMMLGFMVFFYCLGALYDERRDRSLLFWKSLPLSDRSTVLSKAAVALAVTPLLTMAIGMVTSLALLVMLGTAAAFKGLNLFLPLLSSPDFYLAPLRLLALLPVYMLWALPTVGWLLLVSSWARSKVILWAVGAPLGSVALLAWINKMFQLGWDIEWMMQQLVARLLLSVQPGAWFFFEQVDRASLVTEDAQHADLNHVFVQSWQTLQHANVWIGVVLGVTMIAVAILIRRHREAE